MQVGGWQCAAVGGGGQAASSGRRAVGGWRQAPSRQVLAYWGQYKPGSSLDTCAAGTVHQLRFIDMAEVLARTLARCLRACARRTQVEEMLHALVMECGTANLLAKGSTGLLAVGLGVAILPRLI